MALGTYRPPLKVVWRVPLMRVQVPAWDRAWLLATVRLVPARTRAPDRASAVPVLPASVPVLTSPRTLTVMAELAVVLLSLTLSVTATEVAPPLLALLMEVVLLIVL